MYKISAISSLSEWQFFKKRKAIFIIIKVNC